MHTTINEKMKHPPKMLEFSTPHAERFERERYILKILIWVSLFVSLILGAFLSYFSFTQKETLNSMPLLLFLFIPLIFLFLIFITKKGVYIKTTKYLVIFIYLIGALGTSYIWGFDLPISILLDVLVIAISSALLGTRAGLYMTTCICTFMILIGLLQVTETLTTTSSWRTSLPTLDDPFEYAIFLFITMTLSWLSNREIEWSLIRAKQSENELIREKENLEHTVQTRTKELKLSHLNQLSQSRTFVEFGKMASNIIHDLISPFTALTIQLQKIKQGDTHQLMQTFELTKKINELLRSARVSMRFSERIEKFKITEVIEEIRTMNLHMANLYNIRLEVKNTPNTDLFIFGAQHILRQSLCILITNSIEAHCNKPNQDTNLTNTKKPAIVEIEATQENNLLKILISDNASGIPPSIATKLFTPFNTTKGSQGTGIGLYLAKESLAHYFNGTITYAPRPGGGSIFTITLPDRKPEESPTESSGDPHREITETTTSPH